MMRRSLIVAGAVLAGSGGLAAVGGVAATAADPPPAARGSAAAVLLAAERPALTTATTYAMTRPPTLTARPEVARQGGTLVLRGRGFPAQVRIKLLAGPPASEGRAIGFARTNVRGGFRAPIRISRRAATGRFVALACRHDCRIKATAPFSVLAAR